MKTLFIFETALSFTNSALGLVGAYLAAVYLPLSEAREMLSILLAMFMTFAVAFGISGVWMLIHRNEFIGVRN